MLHNFNSAKNSDIGIGTPLHCYIIKRISIDFANPETHPITIANMAIQRK